MSGDQRDDMDQPEDEDGYGLVFPFVVCQSNGGPYDDAAFVAGYQAGQVDKALAAAAAVGATQARFTVRSALVPQLELIGMHHRFPTVTVEAWEEHPEEWSHVLFASDSDGG